MTLTRVLLGLRIFFFLFATAINITFGVYLAKRDVAHSDISWWLFSCETFALMYYATVEILWRRLVYGRLSIMGILGSAVATQGVLANSMDSEVSRILSMLVAANLGFMFSIGVRIKQPSPEEPPLTLTKEKLKEHNGDTTLSEITPVDDVENAPVVEDFHWRDVCSESTSSSESITSETQRDLMSSETLSLILGIVGLVLGISGWVLNLSIWIHECMDKDTCSELGPQWWTLTQTCLLFVMYVVSTGLNRSFEVLATYSLFWAISLSIFLRVANTARSDFFFLKNQEETYQTWNSNGTIVGSSLIATSGAMLIVSLGMLNYAWKAPVPEYARSFRALISSIGFFGLLIFGIGLFQAQKDVCDNNDKLCEWYDGLWVDVSVEIVIVLFGILSVFSQPGESMRAILVALSVVPSYTYTLNISRFLENWDLESSPEYDRRWAVRFSAVGLIILFCVNYGYIFSWGWGKSESLEAKLGKGTQSSLSKSLLKSAKSVVNKQNGQIMHSASQGVELGVINSSTAQAL